ncbi:uncharacterized protein TM35_000411120 [Trypanosoma theileri]|uniref:Uncharacterized protein n=1 Tax=Trypanosoma theileri TaxID=67003 RepID=A0A1X0NJ16_9TRYP|nr:uncharacterized protein TM35_000411120 [Trypanosoma theileri]ORC84742.1 hypothetical protein TM35_000411120 [Trypanosoma theileri]
MTSASIRSYLQQRVQQYYLDVLPSRWRALLSRLARNTQKWQQDEQDVNPNRNLLIDIYADFDLSSALLDEEHQVYREGVSLLHSSPSSFENDQSNEAKSAVKRLLQALLSCIALKETIITHWKSSFANIPPDTLRVYCHACIAHPHLSTSEVERVSALYASI